MLEVIGTNLQDVKEISKTKADQIEFCTDLHFDGLTPSLEKLKKLSSLKNIKKIRVMLRNHYDNFLINKSQINNILKFVSQTVDLTYIDGYVFGAIIKDKTIDFKALEKILENIKDKSLTFHKAFDLVKNKQKQLKKLINYQNIKYVLTSGGPGNPLDNLDFFKNVPQEFKSKILVGGKVDDKVIKILRPLGFKNFHTGSFVRENNSYSSKVSEEKVAKLNEIIEENSI